MTGFEDLDDDVLYLVLDYLYLERAIVLQHLRCISTRLRNFADAVTYKALSLIDDEAHEQITYRRAERLTDASDKISHFVRDLHIVAFRGDDESYCLNTRLITECLNRLQRLDSFSWECDAPISNNILYILKQRFPRAQLCTRVRYPDQNTLSLPQLFRLHVSIPCADLSGRDSISMFRPLKQALLRLPNLRHLLLDTHFDIDVNRMEGAAMGSLQLPLEPGDALPPLESLGFCSTRYNFSEQHCLDLLASIDCKKLRQLKLTPPTPIHFFHVFLGNLPHLTHLEVSDASNRYDPQYFRRRACSDFIAGLKSLQKLVIRCNELDLESGFSKMLVDVHGPSLRHLSIQARQDDYYSPTYMGCIRETLSHFTNLQSLDMALPDIQTSHHCPDCDGYQWGEPTTIWIPPPLPHLRHVNLSMRAPTTEQSLFEHVNKHAHCATRRLWKTFTEDPGTNLETFSLRLWRWETGRSTRVNELIYDTTRLHERIVTKIRHNHDVPTTVYKEVGSTHRNTSVP
ncbi:hypothetical protein EKO04_002678 [Ascochyta lentis]|uniref:F-box domain-containing protein n=1 Tax=Ascochyta lentis TaxID=205686 RepID=A0A8H7JB56_9PLEO|nr:hypothetical protein EKO04_002678 [Ascochyta lentis]